MSANERDYPRVSQAIVLGPSTIPLVLAALVLLATSVFLFGTSTSFGSNPLEIGGSPYP